MPLERWRFDRAHSSIAFHVRHLMISNVHGRFERWDGTLDFDPDVPERSRVEIVIEASSIETREPERDAHLRSKEFLDVESFPQIAFRSRRIEQVTLDDFEVVGDLTIHGITRTVILEASRTGVIRDLDGHRRIGFVVGGHINRKDFGLTWNRILEAGGVLVGDRVTFALELEALRVQETRQVPDVP
jgi:polyisoprenoid-binding protein YceI